MNFPKLVASLKKIIDQLDNFELAKKNDEQQEEYNRLKDLT